MRRSLVTPLEEVLVAGAGPAKGVESALVDAAISLFHARRIPGNVEMEEVGAVALQVHALAGGIGGDEDSHRIRVRIPVERGLDLLALVVRQAAVKLQDAILAQVGAVDRRASWCRRTR